MQLYQDLLNFRIENARVCYCDICPGIEIRLFLYGIIVGLLKQLGMEKLIALIEKKKELRHNIIRNEDYYGDGKIHRLQCFVCKKEC